jgi:hypothetical protein
MEIVAGETSKRAPIHWVNYLGSGGRCSPNSVAGFHNLADPSSANSRYGVLVSALRTQWGPVPSAYLLTNHSTLSSGGGLCYVTGLSLDATDAALFAGTVVDLDQEAPLLNIEIFSACNSVLLTYLGNPKGAVVRLSTLVVPLLRHISHAKEAQPAVYAGKGTRRLGESAVILKRNIEEIESLLGVTRSQLAQALLVERATIYQWFRSAQPRSRTAERVDRLLTIAREWRDAGIGSARSAWYLKLPGSGRALGEMLASEPLDMDALRHLIRGAANQPESVSEGAQSGLEGFAAKSAHEERRRRRKLFPPTFSSEE